MGLRGADAQRMCVLARVLQPPPFCSCICVVAFHTQSTTCLVGGTNPRTSHHVLCVRQRAVAPAPPPKEKRYPSNVTGGVTKHTHPSPV